MDGTSNTIAVGETTYANDATWYGIQKKSCSGVNLAFNAWSVTLRNSSNFRSTKNPINTLPGFGIANGGNPCGTNAAFGSRHAGGANFLWADGHVSYIKNTINYLVYQGIATRDFGETLSADSY